MVKRAAAAAGAMVTACAASGQTVTVSKAVPTLDRWMYVFNQSPPGTEDEARVFSAMDSGFEGSFDIRDGQFLIGFDTSPDVPTGRPLDEYRVIGATVSVRLVRDMVYRYDPTFDALETYLPAGDPAAQPDADPGRPLELFMAGYRNGESLLTFQESDPYRPGAPGLPDKGARSVFAAQYDDQGVAIDVSNNVGSPGIAPFEVRPLAIGEAELAPGVLAPAGADFDFEIDLSSPEAVRYLRESLAAGRLNVVLTSMVTTSQQSSAIPSFYTKESPIPGAGAPRLELRVCVGSIGDWDCSGAKEVADIFAFLRAWFAGDTAADVDGASGVQVADIFAFLRAWFA